MVAIIFSTFLSGIAVPPFIPPMVVVHGAARTFPASFEVLATIVVRSSPVGAGIRRSRPVTVMPDPASLHWIPVTLDPFVVGGWRWCHTIRSWWRRGLPDGDAETDLRVGESTWREQYRRDGDCLQNLSHAFDAVQMERHTCENSQWPDSEGIYASIREEPWTRSN
jgi:hypothetical protein